MTKLKRKRAYKQFLCFQNHLFDNCSAALNALKSKSDLFHFAPFQLASYQRNDTLGEILIDMNKVMAHKNVRDVNV